MNRFVLTLALVVATAVWGWMFVVVKDAVSKMGLMGFLALRFAIATACLAPLGAKGYTRRTVRAGAIVGVALAAGFIFQTWGLRHTSPTNCGLITGLALVLAPLAARALYGVRAPGATMACLGACLVGLILLTAPSPSEFRLGDILTALCAVAFGLHIAMMSRYAPGRDAAAFTVVQLAVSTLIFAGAWPIFETPAWPPAGVWPAILLSAVLASAGAFWVQTKVQQKLSAARTSVILAMEPVFASVFGYLLAGDRLSPLQLIGGGIIIVSLVVAEWVAARRA